MIAGKGGLSLSFNNHWPTEFVPCAEAEQVWLSYKSTTVVQVFKASLISSGHTGLHLTTRTSVLML